MLRQRRPRVRLMGSFLNTAWNMSNEYCWDLLVGKMLAGNAKHVSLGPCIRQIYLNAVDREVASFHSLRRR